MMLYVMIRGIASVGMFVVVMCALMTLASGHGKNQDLKPCLADEKGSCAHCTYFDGSDLTNGCGAVMCKGGCYGKEPRPCALYPASNRTDCDQQYRCPLDGVCANACHAVAPGKPCALPPVMGIHTNECCSRVGCGCNPQCGSPQGCSEKPKDPSCLFVCGCCAPWRKDCWGNPCNCGAPVCFAPSKDS